MSFVCEEGTDVRNKRNESLKKFKQTKGVVLWKGFKGGKGFQ